jgi:hypothetical protein
MQRRDRRVHRRRHRLQLGDERDRVRGSARLFVDPEVKARVALFLLVLSIGCGEEPNIEEIACDEAVERLSECCADFPAAEIECRVDREGCRRGTHSVSGVQITLHDADMFILHASCDDIRRGGVCESAIEATRPTSTFTAGRGQKAYERLSACPQLRSE